VQCNKQDLPEADKTEQISVKTLKNAILHRTKIVSER
jgi:signal recognition particle receptor subunit beta